MRRPGGGRRGGETSSAGPLRRSQVSGAASLAPLVSHAGGEMEGQTLGAALPLSGSDGRVKHRKRDAAGGAAVGGEHKVFHHQPSIGEDMTPFQEYLNAWTMIGPSVYCAWYCGAHRTLDVKRDEDWLVLAMCLGTVAHLPFSFVYHIWCAQNPDANKVDTCLRKLDQVFIHFACITYAFALSGSVAYALLALAANGYFMWKNWQGRISGRTRRRNILLGVVIYLVPVLCIRGLRSFITCALAFAAAAYPFCCRDMLVGYSQSIFHLLTIPYQMVLLESVAPAFQPDVAAIGAALS